MSVRGSCWCQSPRGEAGLTAFLVPLTAFPQTSVTEEIGADKLIVPFFPA